MGLLKDIWNKARKLKARDIVGPALIGAPLWEMRKQAIKPDEVNFENEPSQYRDELTLSDADLANIRRTNLQNLSMLNKPNLAAIKQAGAARRMPSGAILSQLAGSSYNMGRAANQIEPSLRQAQIGSYQNFLNLQQPYEMMEANVDINNQQKAANWDQQMLGSLGKVAMLWQGGYFNSPQMMQSQTMGYGNALPGMTMNNYRGYGGY